MSEYSARACFVVGVLLLVAGAEQALANEKAQRECVFQQADVYVTDWYRMRRVGLTVEAVRKEFAAHVVIRDVDMLADLLSLLRKAAKGKSCNDVPCDAGDFRLVIEFSGGSCGRLFVGEYGRLVDLTDGTWGTIDESFRRRFIPFGLTRRGVPRAR